MMWINSYSFWIEFWNDSRCFGFSTRSVGHVMFSFAGLRTGITDTPDHLGTSSCFLGSSREGKHHVTKTSSWEAETSWIVSKLDPKWVKTNVVPAHQTSDMSRSTISPESRSKLEMIISSSLRFLTIWTFQYVNYQFMCPDFNKH